MRFPRFFIREFWLYFCNNITGLFEIFGIACNPIEWSLFQSRSLKTILLDKSFKDLARILKVWRVHLGGYRTLQIGGLPHDTLRRYYQISVLYLHLGQQGYCILLLHAGLGTAERIQCREEQRKMWASVRAPQIIGSSTEIKIVPYKTICHW